MAASKQPETEWAPMVGFICPLFVELNAVRATFDGGRFHSHSVEGETTYHYGQILSQDVVAVQLPYDRAEPLEASEVVNRLLQHHECLRSPGSYLFLVGIAGAVWSESHDVRLGDVVIARHIWNWSTGKSTERGFVPTRVPKPLRDSLQQKLDVFLYRRDLLSEKIMDQVVEMRMNVGDNGGGEDRWDYQSTRQDVLFLANYSHVRGETCASCDPAKAVERDPRGSFLPVVHDGLIASGSVVLKDPQDRARLQERDALAVEMEACGMPKQYNCFVVRGMSDYADSHKNDTWQPYAAATAAACARLLIASLMGEDPSMNHGLMPTPIPSNESAPVQNEASDIACKIVADNVVVQIADGRGDGGEFVQRFDTCDIILTTVVRKEWFLKEHRLEIRPKSLPIEQACVFWLPLTKLKVARESTCMNMVFSNCKQKSEKKSKQYHEWFEAIYSPRTPNVCLRIECRSEDNAVKLENLFLHQGGLWDPDMKDQELIFPSYTVHNGSIKNGQESGMKGVCFWRHGDAACLEEKYSHFDTAFFSGKLDFEFVTVDEKTNLSLRYMIKINYMPEWYGHILSWPSEEIKANVDGRPAFVDLELEDNLKLDSTRIVVPNDSFTDLLDFAIGRNIGCRAISWYKVEFGFTSSIPGKGPKMSPSQMTLWARDDLLYCLVRYDNATSVQEDHAWEGWSLRFVTDRTGEGGSVRMQVERDQTAVTLKDIVPSSGDYLSLKHEDFLQPKKEGRRRRRSGSTNGKTKGARIQFQSERDVRSFVEVVDDFTVAA